MSDLIPVTQSIQLTPAEQNVVDTQHMAQNVKGAFIAMGGLLKVNKHNAYWSQAGYETWKDYVEQLGIGSYANAMRLIQIFEIVSARILEESDVYEIGLAKVMLLLPLVKTCSLTEEIVALAKNGTTRDLRESLGLKVVKNDSTHSINCSHCGAVLLGAKWVESNEK